MSPVLTPCGGMSTLFRLISWSVILIMPGLSSACERGTSAAEAARTRARAEASTRLRKVAGERPPFIALAADYGDARFPPPLSSPGSSRRIPKRTPSFQRPCRQYARRFTPSRTKPTRSACRRGRDERLDVLVGGERDEEVGVARLGAPDPRRRHDAEANRRRRSRTAPVPSATPPRISARLPKADAPKRSPRKIPP